MGVKILFFGVKGIGNQMNGQGVANCDTFQGLKSFKFFRWGIKYVFPEDFMFELNEEEFET